MTVATSNYYNPTRTTSNTASKIEYIDLGHTLTEEHIGKRVIRVLPYRNDWSNCYYPGTNIEENALKLDKVSKTGLQFSLVSPGIPAIRFLSKNWNDGNWITVEKLVKHLQSNN